MSTFFASMILSELIPFLNSVGATPKKSLSQNFLIDGSIIHQIIELADVSAGDHVLEIGPGPGALTKKLLEKGASVIAVEMDRTFAHHLQRFQNGKLQVFETDFLKFPLEVLPENIKVVANLPYHITTPILEKLFQASFSAITIMIQKEVADRIEALPNTKEFGSLSLFVQFHSNIHKSFHVPAQSFYPKPKVDSTVIRLNSRILPTTNPFHLIRPAFQKRRKMLTSSLPFPKEKIREALFEIGARSDARPEMLSLEEWIQLSLFFTKLY